ncbi:unnamed protein product [Medioppia subpectinata]|uniref:Cadherin Y-type LIR-motif domain-containing protein n=1 Tax=Medioppia subpectinata TaxID=1979941 RepID=A0A7R9PT35_9ACAR|nr:unnamed protein product [Medioppia subpectinata]CAG2100020.1 unnamed protein product [Medioppia subpectinata]
MLMYINAVIVEKMILNLIADPLGVTSTTIRMSIIFAVNRTVPDGKLDVNDNVSSQWRTNSFRSDGSTISAIPSPEVDRPVKDVYYRQTFPVQRQESTASRGNKTLDPNVGVMIRENLQKMIMADMDSESGVSGAEGLGIGLSADDDLRGYTYEGAGSQCSTLSSLASGWSDEDDDFEYLSRLGPRVKVSGLVAVIPDHQRLGQVYTESLATAIQPIPATHTNRFILVYNRVRLEAGMSSICMNG